MSVPEKSGPGTVWIITGGPGAGKSTVSRALLQRFLFGLYLSGDDLRELVVSGIAHASLEHQPESVRQFELARQASVYHAQLYAEAGFEVALDDVIWPQGAQFYLDALHGLKVRRVFLSPGLDTALARNAARTKKSYDTANLIPMIHGLYPLMPVAGYEAEGWTVLDTAELTVEQTVDALLAE